MVNSNIHQLCHNNKQQYSSISDQVKVGSVVWIETMLSKWCEARADPWGQCLGLVSRVNRAGPGNQVTTTHRDKGHQAPRYIGVMSAAPRWWPMSANKEGFSTHLRLKNALSHLSFVFQWEVRVIVTRERGECRVQVLNNNDLSTSFYFVFALHHAMSSMGT